jgi:hypothetical protein
MGRAMRNRNTNTSARTPSHRLRHMDREAHPIAEWRAYQQLCGWHRRLSGTQEGQPSGRVVSETAAKLQRIAGSSRLYRPDPMSELNWTSNPSTRGAAAGEMPGNTPVTLWHARSDSHPLSLRWITPPRGELGPWSRRSHRAVYAARVEVLSRQPQALLRGWTFFGSTERKPGG